MMLNNNGGGGTPDCKTQIKSLWQQVPLFCRFIFITCILVYAVSFALPSILTWLVCAPSKIVQGQVWRLFTGLFVHTQFLELLFSLISYIPQAIQVENEIGTVRMLHRFLLFGILINIIFTAIVAPTGIRQMSIGLWPMLMVDIVSQCMKQPEMPRQLCCFPIQIKAKFYPVVLVLMFSLFFGPQLALFIGLGVGYLMAWGLFNRIELGAARATLFESKPCLARLSRSTGFVSAGNAMGGAILPLNLQRNESSPQTTSSFQAFTGTGVVLGGNSNSQGIQPSMLPVSQKSPRTLEAERQARIEKFRNKHVTQNAALPTEEDVGVDQHPNAKDVKTKNADGETYAKIANTSAEQD